MNKKTDPIAVVDSGMGGIETGRNELREVVASWYYALRNFAIIGLLSVLVYVGIRMIMTSIASDKAKYKVMFKDWLIALCLVVVMHYIMIAILNICTLITSAIGPSGANNSVVANLISDITTILSKDSDTLSGSQIGEAYANIVVLGVNIFFPILFFISSRVQKRPSSTSDGSGLKVPS